MNHSTSYLIMILLLLSACSQENNLPLQETECRFPPPTYPPEPAVQNLCSSDTCQTYLGIWRELLIETNGLSEEFVNEHIEVNQTSLSTSSKGIYFRICYTFKVDWAIASRCDKFVINLTEDERYYPDFNLPRNINFPKETIKVMVENRLASSAISKINPVTIIQYSSFDDALRQATEASKVSNMCFDRLILNRFTGNLILEASAEQAEEENACIYGKVDLISGEIEVVNGRCYI